MIFSSTSLACNERAAKQNDLHKKEIFEQLFFMKFYLFFFTLIAPLFATTISLGGETLIVEIADTPRSLDKGLMGRSELKEGHGMLFVYKEPQLLSFWMKNTKIPLSIAFFDEEKILLNMADMIPLRTDLIYLSVSPALYALEVPQGWFVKHQIKPGMKFSFRDR